MYEYTYRYCDMQNKWCIDETNSTAFPGPNCIEPTISIGVARQPSLGFPALPVHSLGVCERPLALQAKDRQVKVVLGNMYVRDWPAGCLGYTNSARRNATVLQPLVPTPQSEADRAQPSRTTLRRWEAQVLATGSADRKGPGGGRPLKFGADTAFLLWFFKIHYPQATYAECAEWLEAAPTCGQHMPQYQWSRELVRLGFTRKKLEWLSRQRDEAQRCEWWFNTPDPAASIVARGVRGLDHRLLVDLDEKCVWLNGCNRSYGHSAHGERARLRDAIVSAPSTRADAHHPS